MLETEQVDEKLVCEEAAQSDGKESELTTPPGSPQRGSVTDGSDDSHSRAQMDAQAGDEKVMIAKMAQHYDGEDGVESTSSPLSLGSHRTADSDTSCLQKSLQMYEVTLRKDVYGLGIYFTDAHGSAIVDPKLPFYRLPNEVIAPGEASGLTMPGDMLRAINGHVLQGLRFASIVEELRRIPIGDVTLAFERPFPLVTLVLQSDQDIEASPQHQPSNQEEDHDRYQNQGPANGEPGVENNQLENDTSSEENDEKRAKRWSVFQRLSSTATPITGAPGASSIAALEIAALEDLLSEMEAKLCTSEETLEREKKCRFLAEKKNILYRTELLRLSEENTLLRYKLAKEKSARAQKDEFCRTQLHLAI